MKKLIAMIGAAAMAFGLYADEPAVCDGTSFETGEAGVSEKTWTVTTGGLWSTNYGEPFELGEYAGDKYDYGEYPRRDGMGSEDNVFPKGDTNVNYLKLSTGTNTLTRATDSKNYFDQVVKFTGFEEAQTNFVEGTKIAIWTSAFEPSGTFAGDTNLYVAVGTGNTEAPIKNVKIEVDPDFDFNAWHRVTIQNVGKVTDDNRVGFLVWIDGVMADVDDDDLDYFEQKVIQYDKYYDAGQLFIAMQTGTAVSGVGFAGQGCIDDVAVTAVGPKFTDLTIDVTVVAIPGANIVVEDAAGKKITIDPVSGKYAIPAGEFTVTYTAQPGYKFAQNKKEMTVPHNTADAQPINDSETVNSVAVVATKNGTDEYAEDELYDMITTLADGDVVLFNEGAAVTNGEETIFYEFTKNTTIDVTNDDGAITWDVAVSNESEQTAGAFTDNVGVSAGNTLNVWFETAEEALMSLNNDVAGTLKVEVGTLSVDTAITVTGTITAEALNISETITLSGDGKVETTDGKLIESFLPVGQVEKVDGPETDWYTYQLKAADYVAQIVGGDSFESLAEAVEAATTGNTIKMLADVDIQATGLTIPAEKTITLDLAGKTITAANTATGHIQVNGGLTVTDTAEGGQIVSGANGTYGLIQLATAKTDAAAAFTLTAGTISAYFDTLDEDGEHPSYGITVKGNGSTVTVNGGEIYAGYMAISIHGDKSQNAVVDVNAGTVRSSDDFAIYSATTATVTIDGGTVKGGTGAVMIKGGALTVNEGTLISQKPGETGEGTDGTSGADFAVIRVNPINADATVSLQGGTYTADEGTEILAYTPVAGKTADITKAKTVEIPAPADYKWDEDGKLVAKVYVAQVGDDKFETVEEALAKVQELEAAGAYPINVTALADVTIPGTMTGDSLALAKDGTIVIDATSWTITGTVSGTVTLAYGKTLVVPEGSLVTVKPTSEDYEIKKSTADGKDTYTVAEVAKEITITLVKTDSIADIKTNGTSVVGVVKLPADATSIEIELVAASTIKIPVYKVSYAEVGGAVRSKKATYTIKDGDTLTFSAEEASSGDTQVDEAAAKQAFKDLGDDEAAKIDALTTGTDPIAAKAVATWINDKGLDPKTVLAGEFVKASVKLDTTVPITKGTSVQIDTLTKGEGTVLTFKVKVGADDVSMNEAITSMVKATDDLTTKAWELNATVAIEGETVKVTPPTGKTQAFVKVVIPADAPAAE